MKEFVQLVVFSLEEQRYALRLEAVERIVRAVEVTRLPNAPPIVLGAVNVGGRVLPVLNVRRRFDLAEQQVRPTDQFLVAQTRNRTVILLIDEALDVIEVAATDIVQVAEIAPSLGQMQGAVKLATGLLLIHDLDAFLSLDEERALDQALIEA